jgi:hypothetical protein
LERAGNSVNVLFIKEFRNYNWCRFCCCDAVHSNSSLERKFTADEREAEYTVLMKARDAFRKAVDVVCWSL